jgi:hypothetical protein
MDLMFMHNKKRFSLNSYCKEAKYIVRKPMSKMSLGRPKTRWVDDVRKDKHKLKVPNWKTLAQDR